MIRLRVLGPVDLQGSHGDELATVLAQPKRLSVLAYLAAASPRGFHRRDSMVALFWPELDDFHARKALNQALGFLRRELQSVDEVLVSRGSEALGIDPRHCWCDAVAFEDAVKEGRHPEALELYRGDFLQGWFVDEAGGFEEWTERQRSRLRGLAVDAARAVAEAQRLEGNYTDAIHAAERAVELSRSDERVVRDLLEILDDAGDRAGALKAYADFARRLADDLGVEPSSETSALVDRMRSRTASVAAARNGSVARASDASDSRQPIPASSEADQSDVDVLESTASRDASGPLVRSKRYAYRWIAAVVGATAMSLLIALGVLRRGENSNSAPNAAQPRLAGTPSDSTPSLSQAAPVLPPAAAPDSTPSRSASATTDALDPNLVAVLPFRVTGSDSSLTYLREGMLDLLSAKFIGSLNVVDPRTLLAAWRRVGGERADADTQAVASLARRLGAGLILDGSITPIAGTLVFTASLREFRDGTTRHASAEGPGDSVLAVIDRLVTELLAFRAREDLGSVASLRGMPLSTVREYLAGRYLSRQGRFEDAIPHYRAAIAADSDFALAGLGLAQASLATFGGTWLGWRVAARGRNKLNERDRAILYATIGPTDSVTLSETALRALREAAVRVAPDRVEAWARNKLNDRDREILDATNGAIRPVALTQTEMRALRELAVRAAPDRVEAWALLGDSFLEGAGEDVADWPRRAIAAYDHALALDSTYLPAAEFLPFLYLRVGDSMHARQATEHLLRLDSTSSLGSYNLWSAGAAFGDEGRRTRGLTALSRQGAISAVSKVKFFAFATGIGFEDYDRLFQQLLESAATDLERQRALVGLHEIAVLRGQPARAARIANKSPAAVKPWLMLLISAVFEDADSAVAADFRDHLPESGEVDTALNNCRRALLTAEYDLAVRRDSTLAAANIRLIDARLTPAMNPHDRRHCMNASLSLSLLLSMSRGDQNLRRRAESLDSILRTGPFPLGNGLPATAGNLILARAWERLNEPRRALAALRRRSTMWEPATGFATMLREEGRLAAATGDREGAIRAYRIFIALRRDAEPRLQPQVAAARSELARLERNKRQHQAP